MPKKVTDSDVIRVGWDYNHRKKNGEIPAIYIHYKNDEVVFADEHDLTQQLLAKMDEIDRRLERLRRPRR
jgi:hypothetical protein